jgi:hypothetical protein
MLCLPMIGWALCMSAPANALRPYGLFGSRGDLLFETHNVCSRMYESTTLAALIIVPPEPDNSGSIAETPIKSV